jgi:hypothetical protein
MSGRDYEAVVAKDTARRAIFVGPPLIAIFGFARGVDGGVASLIGVIIVAGYIWFSGAMMSVAARISLGIYHAAALLGFFLRLGLIAATMLVVARVTDVDRMALGITVVIAYLTLFGWEAVAMSKSSEREMEWT